MAARARSKPRALMPPSSPSASVVVPSSRSTAQSRESESAIAGDASLCTPHTRRTSPRLSCDSWGEGCRDAARQTAATEGHEGDLGDAAERRHDLEAEAPAVAGDDVEIVIGGDEARAVRLGFGEGLGQRFGVVVVRRGRDHQLGAVASDLATLDRGCRLGDDDACLLAEHARRSRRRRLRDCRRWRRWR